MLNIDYDVIIIGGGIHGVGVAQGMAAAGYSTLVVEQNQWASGTSSKSSKLIHGGLRYLETAQFNLVKECLRERAILLKIAPHLVHPLSEAGPGAARRFKVEGLREGWVWAERSWLKLTDDTGVGNPARATAEKGQRYLEAMTQKIAGFLVDLAACDLDDLYE